MRKLTLKGIAIIIIVNLLIFTAMPVKANEGATDNIPILGYIGEQVQTRSGYGSGALSLDHYQYKWFYLKNAFSGKYMDVSDGIAQNGKNVWQYEYNGTNAQKWYLNNNGDGTFSLYSGLGNNYVLDVADGSGQDNANVHIWEYNGTDAQKFKIGYTSNSIYCIVTKVSNYEKAVVTQGAACEQGHNINQYDYSGNWNELWILEPVEQDIEFGVKYAIDNHDDYVRAFPNLHNNGGDCTNFVSQCMLAAGIHTRDNWYIYRKNAIHSDIDSNAELDLSWDLSDPSPWISAGEFKDFWVSRASKAYKVKAQDALNNLGGIANSPITKGCVVQIADNWLGSIGTVRHSMYVTDYGTEDGYGTFILTYHSTNTLEKTLTQLFKQYSNSYFLIYVF